METILGVACCGTYDEGDTLDHRVLRWKAARLAALRYRLLVRWDNRCGCSRCEIVETDQYQTEL